MSMHLNYIDIHSHLYFPDYNADRDQVIATMKERGIGTITIGTTLEMSQKAVDLAAHDHLWACVGIHPVHGHEAPAVSDVEAGLRRLVAHPKVVAIGECGFDYFRLTENAAEEKRKQRDLFELQIQLAIETGKPLMLHIRDGKTGESAHDDVLALLSSYKATHGDKLRGNCHFFAGSPELAKRYLDLGFTLSFTGVITFVRDYDDVIKFAPRESIMIETDAPFVAPVPYRGKRNEPTYVIEVAKKIAEVRGEDPEELRLQFLQNTAKTFNLKIF